MLIEPFTLLKKSIFFFCLSIFLPQIITAAAPGDSLMYDIKLTLNGIKTNKVMLGFYVGESTYIVDSAQVDLNTSAMRFKPNRPLAEGVYFVATNEGILFDMILAGKSEFHIETKILAPYDSAHIKNSRENSVFFEYMRRLQKTQTEVSEIHSMINMLRRAKADRGTLSEQQIKIRDKYEQQENFTHNLIKQNPTLLVSKLLNMTLTPTVPSEVTPLLDNKKPNPFYWSYFRKHFFDGVDFTDKRLLRSPNYTKRLEQFLGYMSTNPDSVKAELDFILDITRTNPDYYRFTLQWLTAVFDNNVDKIYNADAYLVHLVEKYHRNLDSGTDKYTLERLDYKANAFKKVLIGSPAPPFALPNTEGVSKALTDVKTDYTLLIFYSSLCSHCRTVMPKIQNSLQYIDNSRITIFTVCTDGERNPWLTFIDEMKMKDWTNVLDEKLNTELQKKYVTWNLPVMYLLDKNKTILANRIKPENLPDLLRGLLEMEK
jgi:peroxiredoxin